MKRTLLLSILTATLILGACNSNADKAAKEKQDSIKAAASADSLLQDALKSDTLSHDTLKAKKDTVKADTSKK